jgi:hypothetical protein
VIIEDSSLENQTSMNFFMNFVISVIKLNIANTTGIVPQKIKLPSIPENFGRKKIGLDNFYLSLLEKIEKLFNIQKIYSRINSDVTRYLCCMKYVIEERKRRKLCPPPLFSNFHFLLFLPSDQFSVDSVSKKS